MFPETKKITTNSKVVVCEGETPVVGHPRVYLEMGEKPQVTCPYCGRVFVHNSHNS